MTIGVGGSTAEAELAALRPMRGDAPAIGDAERTERIARAQAEMRAAGIDALWLDVSASLTYFTGLRLRRSEKNLLEYRCPQYNPRPMEADYKDQKDPNHLQFLSHPKSHRHHNPHLKGLAVLLKLSHNHTDHSDLYRKLPPLHP